MQRLALLAATALALAGCAPHQSPATTCFSLLAAPEGCDFRPVPPAAGAGDDA